MTDHDAFAERGRAVEEEYFRRKDRELVERMRQTAAADRARDAMSAKTGIQDPALLKDLEELGFTPETVTLLPLVPLLEIAWAEGEVTPAEGALLTSLARSRNIAEGTDADNQLTEWMHRRPDPAVFEHAGRLISAILGSGQQPAMGGLTADEIVAYSERIAAASGGLLGLRIGSISSEERGLLSRIASDLKTRHR